MTGSGRFRATHRPPRGRAVTPLVLTTARYTNAAQSNSKSILRHRTFNISNLAYYLNHAADRYNLLMYSSRPRRRRPFLCIHNIPPEHVPCTGYVTCQNVLTFGKQSMRCASKPVPIRFPVEERVS